MPDAELTGDDLFTDTDALLEKLCAVNPKAELIIGLDDLHNLYDSNSPDQPVLNQLLKDLSKWGRFAHTMVQKGYDREHRQSTFDTQYRRQVFIISTGMDLGNEEQDVDTLMTTHPSVDLYNPTNIESFHPAANLTDLPIRCLQSV